LLRAGDMIYHADVQLANMVRNHHLAKSLSDAGWGAFLAILAFKAACAGKRAVAVPLAYTSQLCSGCGAIVSKGSSVRWHCRPDCGTSPHSDHNAARNVGRLGQSRWGGVALAAAEYRVSLRGVSTCQTTSSQTKLGSLVSWRAGEDLVRPPDGLGVIPL
jgi:transposase